QPVGRIGPGDRDRPRAARPAGREAGKGRWACVATEPGFRPPRAHHAQAERSTIEIEVESSDRKIPAPDGFHPGGAERDVVQVQASGYPAGDASGGPDFVVLRAHVD